MENNFISNEAAPIINNFNPDDIPRCPECNLICSLILEYNEDNPNINYKCENKHKGIISLEEYMSKYNKFALSKEKCDGCGKIQKDIKGTFGYCSKCIKFLCYPCQLNHPNGDRHDIFNYIRYDSLCKIHSNGFDSYCVNCQKNLCIYCKKEHLFHDIIDLSLINYSKEREIKVNEEIKKVEKKIEGLEIIKQNIIKEIDKIKESTKYEIKFIKLLLSAYHYENQLYNLNYYVIQNITNIEKLFKTNKINIIDKIYKEGNKYIQLLKVLQNIKSNSFNNNFKNLNYHTKSINHIHQLNDGRLISCSSDSSLNIYNNNSYELQLSIKEHSDCIRSFTQLNDERIITCSSDKTMKIIKLIGEDKYQIEQTLQGHTDQVYKIIEIKENKLISISTDKTMKIWKLNNENTFECIKTITFQNSESNCNIFRLNENQFVTSSYNDKCLKFWNSNIYSNIATLNNIETDYGFKRMCLLEDDLLCVGGNNSKGFYLIKISNHQLIKNIPGPKNIYSIIECLDGLFLCSIIDENGNNCLVKYKYEEENLKKIIQKEKVHNSHIYTCVELNDGIIASGGNDSIIKLWKK